MRIGFFQYEPVPRRPGANLERIRRELTLCRADLVVLPELCTAGYLYENREDLGRFAEPVPGGSSCATMADISRNSRTTIVWGMAESAGPHIFNSAVMVTPQGRFETYRKAHLFDTEKGLFDPGDSGFPVFELRGVKVGLLVCFDHFFPEAARSQALSGAQVICHPSNLVLDFARTTTAARAIENRVFWVMANRTGSETACGRTLRFNGGSQIIAPDGSVLCRADQDSEESAVVEIDPAQALDKHVTPHNDLLLDRRTDLYRL
jgi:predicted amidohydrolase